MQKENEFWDSSSCHSFCSTNERHFGGVDIGDEKLDFEADPPETVSPRKGPQPCAKDVSEEEGEVEEGEIKDSSNVESCDDAQQRCRFFEKGLCAFGEKCRFLHQSDKGLYTMFDRPRLLSSRSVCRRPTIPTRQLKTEITFPAAFSGDDVADWDRELEEAMLRVGFTRKNKVPVDELDLAIRAPSVDESMFPTSPILENDASVRRVRYRGEDEPKRSGSVSSKRNNTRSREKARSPSSNSSRYGKRRYSDVSRSRSRSRSVGRRFSCRCCRTPSPKVGRHRASRRPICCYRRKSISSSSCSSSPVSRRRAVMRRVRDVVNGTRRKRRGRSRTSSTNKTKSRQYKGGSKVSDTRGLSVRESQTSNKRRNGKALAPSSPKVSKISGSSHKKSISSTSHSSAKVDKLAASYSLSDMSISPYSSDSSSDSGNEPDKLSSSVRRPSDMSISPFSDSLSPVRFSISVSRADEPTNGVAAKSPPPVPRKMSKSDGSAHGKRVKNDVAEGNSDVILPQVPLPESLIPKKISKRDVQETKPFASSREKSNSVSPTHRKRLKADVAEPKSSVALKSGGFNPKEKLEKDVAEPKLPAHPQKIPKSGNSTPKQQCNHLLFDLMKYHKKGKSTKVTSKVAHPVERMETSVTKVCQKSDPHKSATLSKKELLLKQLQEVTAAIERKKAQLKQKQWCHSPISKMGENINL